MVLLLAPRPLATGLSASNMSVVVQWCTMKPMLLETVMQIDRVQSCAVLCC